MWSFLLLPFRHICDSPFAANLASLPRLPINTSYASSTSVNISGFTTLLVCSGGATNQKFSVATIPNGNFSQAFEQLDGMGKKWELTFGTTHV